MWVKSIVEYSKRAFCNTFPPSLSYHLLFKKTIVLSLFEWLFQTPGFTVFMQESGHPMVRCTLCFTNTIWAMTCDFQQCGILTSVDSDEPMHPPVKLRNSKWCSVSSLTIIEYSSDKQRLWSHWAYAQADLRLCWPHIPHCWKSLAVAAHF